MKSIIEGRIAIHLGMTNSDACIEPGLAEALTSDVYATYTSYYFYAYVIAHGNGFMCQVWTHGSPCREYHADTLEDIMDEVQNDFGVE